MQKVQCKLLAASALMLATQPAFAQQPTSDELQGTSAPSQGVADIVVYARRVQERAQTVPLAITVLNDEALRRAEVVEIADLQGQAPSLFIATGASGPTAAAISIRGQVQSDSKLYADPSVAIYIDDVNIPRQVGLRAAFLDLQAVEVLKGPQGTLFGKNTTGGALLLTSKRPNLSEVGGFAEGSAGSNGFLRFTAAVSVPIVTDKLAIRFAAQNVMRDGFGRNGIGQRLGNVSDFAYRASLRWEPSDSVRLFLSTDYDRFRTDGPNTVITHINPLAFNASGSPINGLASPLTEIARALGLAPPTGTPSRTAFEAAYEAFKAQSVLPNGSPYDMRGVFPTFAHLRLRGYSADFSADVGDLTFRSITGHRSMDRNEQLDYDTTIFNILKPSAYVYSKQFTQELQLLNGKDNPLSFIMGLFYSHEKGDEGGVTVQIPLASSSSPNVSDFTIKNVSYAAFVQANYRLTDRLKLTGGLRYTKITQDAWLRNRSARGCSIPNSLLTNPPVCETFLGTSAKKPSYLVSLDYQVNPDVLLYAKTSSSFRGGGVNAKATGNADAFTTFKPELATDYELGFKSDLLDRRLRVNGAAYYTNYKDIQRTVAVILNNVLVTRNNNAATAKIYGAELEVTARPVSRLSLGGSFGWVHARYGTFFDAALGDRSNDPFPVPEYQFSLNGSYRQPIGGGELEFHTNYSWQSTVVYRPEAIYDDTVTQKKFGLWDARISYQTDSNPNLSVALFCKNITDKRYFTNFYNFDSSLGYNMGYVAQPRFYGFELRFKLNEG